MIVFRHARVRVRLAELVAEVRAYLPGSGAAVSRPARDDAVLRLLLAAGGLECALSDHWGGEDDAWRPAQRAAMDLSIAAAETYLGLLPRVSPVAAFAALAQGLPPPETMVVAACPEGFRYYALSPAAYVEPARRLAAAQPRGPVLVIGLRTIGSTLAPVVAAVLRATGRRCDVFTLRPHGHPEDRTYRANATLRRYVQQWPGLVAVVDEGPGLSGSSFGGAVRWVQAQGVALSRIVLLPSWNPSGKRLCHTVVAREWDKWCKFPASEVAPRRGWGRDLSGGGWRKLVPRLRDVPVWPQEERVKFLARNGRWLYKFSGLGRTHAEAADRSRALAGHGFSVAGVRAGEGWLRFPWRAARPLQAAECTAAAWTRWAGSYFAFLRSAFALGPSQPPSAELQAMTAANVRALAGAPPPPLPPEAPPVRLDGRVLWHEWAVGEDGTYLKFDALDHGDDHFFPGPADIAWDLAGMETEFGSPCAEAVIAAYQSRSGDRELYARLPWYRVAYTAFRAAFAAFAQELVGPPDAAGFRREHLRYLRRLQRALAATSAGSEAPGRAIGGA
jgi:hypothetical protein